MHAFHHKVMINKFSQLHANQASQLQQNKVNAPPSQSLLVKGVLHQVIKHKWFQLAKTLFKETQKEVIGGFLMTVNKQSIVQVISVQHLHLVHKSLVK